MGVFDVISTASTFAGQCEAWVEIQLTGSAGKYPNALAAQSASDFVQSSDPSWAPAGIAVVFGAASSNQGQGHTGTTNGGGLFTSPLDQGQYAGDIVEEPISTFASQNGAALLGFHNFGRKWPGWPGNGTPTTSGAVLGTSSGADVNLAKAAVAIGLLVAAAILVDQAVEG